MPEAGARRGLTSNSLYGAELGALEEKMKAVNLTAEPAQDYEFLSQQYPVPDDTPDLDGQISKFLALPPPIRAPRQTLWVFTFGTWDVWSLAAFPRRSPSGKRPSENPCPPKPRRRLENARIQG